MSYFLNIHLFVENFAVKSNTLSPLPKARGGGPLFQRLFTRSRGYIPVTPLISVKRVIGPSIPYVKNINYMNMNPSNMDLYF